MNKNDNEKGVKPAIIQHFWKSDHDPNDLILAKKEVFTLSAGKPICLAKYPSKNGKIQIDNPPMSSALKAKFEAEKHRSLKHYTNIDALLKILVNRTILFNRIDRVNDVEESRILGINRLFNRTFIACFNHSKDESIPLWHIYTTKGYGVCIEFFLKEGKTLYDLFDKNKAICTNNIDVEISWKNNEKGDDMSIRFISVLDTRYGYDEEYEEGVYVGENENAVDFNAGIIGAYKDKAWGYEEETRYVTVLNPIKHLEERIIHSLYVPMDFKALKGISVTFDPWMESETKECIKHEIDRYYPGGFISYNDSRFMDRIHR